MPVRSLSSRVIRWPDRQEVEAALGAWADASVAAHSEIRRIGYFGSYARGGWGVGIDLDVVVLVSDDAAPVPFERHAAAWDLTALPVPADLLVYTQAEWQALMARTDRFARMLKDEMAWVR
jgi:uncharacterized protein